MHTDREQKLVHWLRSRKVATMRQLQHQFQVCHMTVFRALKKSGYHTSYNHNAGYYTLAGLPQFDEWGLWAYRDIRFSLAGTLLETLVALVTQAPAGLTVGESEEHLQTPAANLLSRLVQQGRLQRQVLRAEQWARQLHTQGRQVTAGQVRQVQEHYGLKKNGRSEPVRLASRSRAAGHRTTPAGRDPAHRGAFPL